MDEAESESIKQEHKPGAGIKKSMNNLGPMSSTSGKYKKVRRKYHEQYLCYGFTWTGNEEKPSGLCVECGATLSNSSLSPAKLKRHLQTKHAELTNKSIEYFKRKSLEGPSQKPPPAAPVLKASKKALVASYRVSYRIAKSGEAHTIAETLIQPCVRDIVECMIDEKYVEAIDRVPLSNSTISRRIKELSAFCEAELMTRVSSSPYYSLQMDESTDVSGFAILLVFVRYVYFSGMEEDVLMCKQLKPESGGEDIFSMLDLLLIEHEISWEKCSSICIDGLTDKISEAVGYIKTKHQHIVVTQCLMHTLGLVVKEMPTAFQDVVHLVSKIISFIKSKTVKNKVFGALCEEMGSSHTTLLSNEVRWLSRGKILTRFFELREEIGVFLLQHPTEAFSNLKDIFFQQSCAYLADIFSQLNLVNMSLQCDKINFFGAQSRIDAFQQKLQLWADCVKGGNNECFAILNKFLVDSQIPLYDSVKSLILEHLNILKCSIPEMIPPLDETLFWIQNPFSDAPVNDLTVKAQEQLIDIVTDYTWKTKFQNETELSEFWTEVGQEFPDVGDAALKFLSQFPTKYLCEKSFPIHTAHKTKFRKRLNIENELRLQITSITPDFLKICEQKQAHVSH